MRTRQNFAAASDPNGEIQAESLNDCLSGKTAMRTTHFSWICFFGVSIAIPGFSHKTMAQSLMFKASLTPA
ncbi:MAG: hypothetical protein RLZZ536_2196 [Planctomycetota bacterium]|jgi:hypothetical protein